MDVGTGDNLDAGIPSQNYGVLALQHYVFKKSNISAIFINRESLGLDYTKYDSAYRKYNREAGIEYNLASGDDKWTGKFLAHKSFSPGLSGKDYMYAGYLKYTTKPVTADGTLMYAGENFNPEVGYMPRTSFYQANFHYRYKFFVKSNWLLSHGPELKTTNYFDTSWKLTDNENRISYDFEFLDRSNFGFGYGFDYVKLQNPFDPTNSGGLAFPEGSEFHTTGWGFSYASSPSKLFTLTLNGQTGTYYNGKLSEIDGILGYRLQPYGGISVNFAYNDINLTEPYKSARFWLIGPKLDVTFTNKLFFATFLQYNQQADNFNINSRFQWRFAPASDIFLVYTENYLPGDFSTKNRAIVLKFTYWYNL